ncbi:MAG: hypothetical protein WCL28_12535, partial [bacterium]
MFFLKPFKSKATRGEAGNMLLITGLIASAIAVTGGKVMLDRSTAQRKANQMAQSMKQAKEIPGSAAMIAKALISLPPHVAENQPFEWTFEKLKSPLTNNMPLVYPLPYVSGVIGSPAQPAASVDKTRDPPAGANWGDFTKDGALSATVRVFTNDRTQASAQDVNRVMGSKSVTGGSDAIKRTESRVTYVFRNCDSEGKKSQLFTGIYCASANIKSDNYAGGLDANGKPTTVNEANAELGSITPPPSPECGVISSSSPKVKAGESFALVVNVKGVGVGYNVRLVSPTVPLSDQTLKGTGTNKISLPWNDPRFERPYTISDIPTSKVASALVTSGANEMVLDVDLTAVDGQVKTCSGVRVQLDKPIVSCEVGSLFVERTGSKGRSCRVELRKDNGAGIVKQVRVEQINKTSGVKTVKNFPPNFSGSKWQDSVDCEQDGWRFNAFLVRENPAGTPQGESQCSPEKLIDELPPQCVTNSLQVPYRNAPNGSLANLLKCRVAITKTDWSHNDPKVMVNGEDRTAMGVWTGPSVDRKHNWSADVPCPANVDKMSVFLERAGATPSLCGEQKVDTVDPALCEIGSFSVTRLKDNPSKCGASLRRLTKSSQFVEVKINNSPSTGTWLGQWLGDSWTIDSSRLLDCDLAGGDYKGTLIAADGLSSDCGTFKLPPLAPICQNINASRNPSNGAVCDVTITKGPGSGPVSSAIVMGKVIGSADQSEYTTQVPCSVNGETIAGSLRNSGGDSSCPSFTVPSSLCSSTPSFIDFIVQGTAVAASSTINSAQRSCYKYVSAVCVGGGGGGRNVNKDDDNGGGGGALAWFANRPLVDTDTYTATGGRAGPYGGNGGSSSVQVNGKFIINAVGGGSNNSAGGTRQIPTTVAGSTTWMGIESIAGVTYGGGNGG